MVDMKFDPGTVYFNMPFAGLRREGKDNVNFLVKWRGIFKTC